MLNKHDFARRFATGEFGNMTPVWLTLEEYLASGYQGEVCLRSRIPGAPTYYSLSTVDSIPPNYYLSAMIPRDVEAKLVIQGEVLRGPMLSLTYTTVAKPMKIALAEETKHVELVAAMLLLQHTLNFHSYKWLMKLLTRYPDHVVEFSTYSVEYGTVPGHNTLFWEVRQY